MAKVKSGRPMGFDRDLSDLTVSFPGLGGTVMGSIVPVLVIAYALGTSSDTLEMLASGVVMHIPATT